MIHSPIDNRQLFASIIFASLVFITLMLCPFNTTSASGTNSFNVKTVIKNTSYPWYEKALDTVYEVNGEQGKTLVLTRDKTYRFKINTGLKHDFYFSNNESGRGAGVITSGISKQFIHKGIIHFTPTLDTPEEVYYQCQNHPYMGGKIYIVNEGESFTPPSQNIKPVEQVKAEKITPQKLARQHLGQASAALNASAERIANSQNEKAKVLFNRALAISEDANAWLAGGDIISATEDTDIVLMLINAAEKKLLEEQSL
ncbi:MAG: hypothetical protein L3J70_04970 [Gammaproteobacteria bacterium]|nr:hypothetical protein [Gammaproteobacteria bacterium]